MSPSDPAKDLPAMRDEKRDRIERVDSATSRVREEFDEIVVTGTY